MTLKSHNSFQNKKNIKTTHRVLLPNLNKKLQQEVRNSVKSLHELELRKSLPRDKLHKPKTSKTQRHHIFSTSK